MPTLILYLPRTPSAAPEFDYLLSPDGQQVSAQGRAAPSLLPARGARDTEVVAVLPAQALSWHPVALPERVLRSLLGARSEPARVRGVLAGVLEEQLLDEPDLLHFAVFAGASGQGEAARQAWVAVCDRAWLQAALQSLEMAGCTVGRMVAECTPLPTGSARLLLDAQQQPAHMALCSAQGVALLPLTPATLGLAQAQPDLQVFAEPAVMALAQSHFGNQVQLQTRAERLLLAAQSPWNLAQLELRASSANRLQRRLAAGWQQCLHGAAWRPVRWGLLALLLVQVVALNALAWQQRSVQAQQKAAIQDVLRQTFPEVQLVVDAPLQMQRAVDALARARGVGADTDVARVFAILGPLAPQGMAVSALALNGSQLQLTTTGLDAANAQPLLAGLQAHGLRGQLQGAQLSVTQQESR